MENRVTHLQMLQSIIERFATAQFVIRGWAVTLVAGTFALASKDAERSYFLIAYLPTVAFWLLDAFYLSQERGYRHVFNEVRAKQETAIDFEMKPKAGFGTWVKACFAIVLLLFYGGLFAAIALVTTLATE